jgi:putative peptidoglycan lipid II flippase
MTARAGGPGSLARGAAVITIATALSRVTGFARVLVVAGAMGATFLANTYQTANTAPNVIFELLAAGVLTSVFVPTFVDYIVRGEREEGWAAGNALTSVALVALVGIAALLGLAAPLVMRVLTLGVDDTSLRADEIALGARFLRLFAPQIVFYGAGMIMTGVLHAHRRFGIAAAAPIFNNVIVIVVYLVYAGMRSGAAPTVRGITPEEVWVLGAGTTLGVVAMTVCLIPQLRRLGWRFRWRFDLGHPAVRRGARLGVWALGYAGGYQAGLIVVLLLANRIEGGVAAYQWAYTFFYMPHALFAIPIFSVLFTAMAEHAAQQDTEGILERLQQGLSLLAFALVPVAAALIALSHPLSILTLEYGVMTPEGAALVGRVIAAFAIGLPTFSVFLIFTRAFYALGLTKVPTVVNAIAVATSSAAGVIFFFSAAAGWEVAGLALAHSLGFAIGALLLGKALVRKLGRVTGTRVVAAVLRAAVAGTAAFVVMLVGAWRLPEGSNVEALINVVVAGTAGAIVYVVAMAYQRSPELAQIGRLLGRRG